MHSNTYSPTNKSMSQPRLANYTYMTEITGDHAALATLVMGYLRPWRGGVTQEAVDEAHLHWADYRDPQWGGHVALGEAHNRLLRINIIGGRLYYYGCVGAKSRLRLRRQQAVLRLVQAALDSKSLPDLDLVLSLADRPTVPRRAWKARGKAPPPVFGYVHTPWHHSLPFPYQTFDHEPWAAMHAQLSTHRPLVDRSPAAIWRGSCNSLCDMMHRSCALPRDGDLMPRQALLRAAAHCPDVTNIGITARHRNCASMSTRCKSAACQACFGGSSLF
jgi:hypothetical protein